MKAIACVDRFLGLGYKGNLLFNLHEDMVRFKELTTGNTVVMGYNTYKSLPHGALPNRRNIVLSQNHQIFDKNVVVLRSKKSLMKYLEKENIDTNTVWVIGGSVIYKELIDECDEIFLTVVDDIRKADTFFVDISDWKAILTEDCKECEIRYQMQVLRRRNIDK